jgi:hypothetical protein
MPAEPKDAAAAQTELLARYEAAEDKDSLPAEERSTAGTPGTGGVSAAAPTGTAPAVVHPAPSTPASVAAEDKSKHPAWLARKAKKLGVDDDELAELDTDGLRDRVSDLQAEAREEKIIRAVLNAKGQPYNPENGQLLPRDTPAGAPIASPGAATSATAQPQAGEPTVKLALTAADLEAAGYDGALAGVLEKAVAPLLAKISEQDKTIRGLVGAERTRRTGDALNALDRQFTKHPAVYGEGALDDLDPGSKEYRRRMTVIRELQALPPQQSKGLAKDFAVVHGDTYAHLAEAKPDPKPAADPAAEANGHVNRIGDKFANGHVSKPSDSQPPRNLPKGRAGAIQGVEAMIRQQQTDGGEEPEEQDLA